MKAWAAQTEARLFLSWLNHSLPEAWDCGSLRNSREVRRHHSAHFHFIRP
jgi:hypothetical protein